MHYFTFADKDTTIYEVSSSLNSGMDEILEVKKDVSSTGDIVQVSRVLIKFDLSYISESISRGLIPNPSNGHYASSSYYLNLYDAKPEALATSQSLFSYPISQSWSMGDGHTYDNPITTEGTSWM